MQGEKAGTFDIPVRVVGVGHQRIRISQQKIEGGNDGGVGLVLGAGGGGSVGGFHIDTMVTGDGR
ncbi:hypothetical protein D3C83_166100 [compost metagenome]